MTIYNYNPYHRGARRGRGGEGWGGSKKFKSIPAPPPLRGGENPRVAKWGGAGKNCHP